MTKSTSGTIGGHVFETMQDQLDITVAGDTYPQYTDGLLRCRIDGRFVTQREWVDTLRLALTRGGRPSGGGGQRGGRGPSAHGR